MSNHLTLQLPILSRLLTLLDFTTKAMIGTPNDLMTWTRGWLDNGSGVLVKTTRLQKQ